MARTNPLVTSPPYAIEKALKELGRNLRTARLRRNLDLKAVAERLGVDRHTLADAERGKVSVSIAVYAGALWVFGMVEQLSALAAPDQDQEGLVLAQATERQRASAPRGLSNDF